VSSASINERGGDSCGTGLVEWRRNARPLFLGTLVVLPARFKSRANFSCATARPQISDGSLDGDDHHLSRTRVRTKIQMRRFTQRIPAQMRRLPAHRHTSPLAFQEKGDSASPASDWPRRRLVQLRAAAIVNLPTLQHTSSSPRPERWSSRDLAL
jgi:hypothetical protein